MDKIKKNVKNWVREVVLGLNLCPFAHPVFNNNQISYELIENADFSESLMFICDKMINLSETPCEQIATSLIILPDFDDSFEDYLDLLYASEEMLGKIGFKSIFQLASFHPQYVFEDKCPDDISNYTNRSPHAVVHIIREDDVEKARRMYKNIEDIPIKNIETLSKLGEDEIKAMFDKLMSKKS